MKPLTTQRLAAFGAVLTLAACGKSVQDPAACVEPDPQAQTAPVCDVVGVEPGHCAPDFALPDKTGTLVSLSDFRGKVVVLNLFEYG
jgi:cytochrome oxidase Cu insertion factor (SCO1/SenC/PrrC family)